MSTPAAQLLNPLIRFQTHMATVSSLIAVEADIPVCLSRGRQECLPHDTDPRLFPFDP